LPYKLPANSEVILPALGYIKLTFEPTFQSVLSLLSLSKITCSSLLYFELVKIFQNLFLEALISKLREKSVKKKYFQSLYH